MQGYLLAGPSFKGELREVKLQASMAREGEGKEGMTTHSVSLLVIMVPCPQDVLKTTVSCV